MELCLAHRNSKKNLVAERAVEMTFETLVNGFAKVVVTSLAFVRGFLNSLKRQNSVVV